LYSVTPESGLPMDLLAELRDDTGSGYPTRSAVAYFCVMSDTGNGSAPGVMATRARAVHHRQRTAR
jgi:hypothetical protein